LGAESPRTQRSYQAYRISNDNGIVTHIFQDNSAHSDHRAIPDFASLTYRARAAQFAAVTNRHVARDGGGRIE
jgi:hypothetical protein